MEIEDHVDDKDFEMGVDDSTDSIILDHIGGIFEVIVLINLILKV